MDTFLVRVWRPDGEERSEGLRGTAVHVSSGREVTFTEPEALVELPRRRRRLSGRGSGGAANRSS